MNIHWKDWWWSWSSNTWATWCEELTHWKRPWCWERLKAGVEGDHREWDGWKASLTQWTRVWVNSGCWWWTGKLSMLQSMGSQRFRHDWAIEVNWTEWWNPSCLPNETSIKNPPASRSGGLWGGWMFPCTWRVTHSSSMRSWRPFWTSPYVPLYLVHLCSL